MEFLLCASSIIDFRSCSRAHHLSTSSGPNLHINPFMSVYNASFMARIFFFLYGIPSGDWPWSKNCVISSSSVGTTSTLNKCVSRSLLSIPTWSSHVSILDRLFGPTLLFPSRTIISILNSWNKRSYLHNRPWWSGLFTKYFSALCCV